MAAIDANWTLSSQIYKQQLHAMTDQSLRSFHPIMKYKVKRDIARATKSIRAKYNALKRGRLVEENILETTFKPITKTLKEMNPPAVATIKQEPKKEPDEHYSDAEDDSFQTPPHTIKKEKTTPHWRQFNSGAASYMQKFVDRSELPSLDTTYGVYHDAAANQWKIGNSVIQFEDTNINIDGALYEETPGLYELLFMKEPKNYTQADLEIYRNILHSTNAHRRNYDANEKINGNKSKKYKQIISKLAYSGKGMMKYSKNAIDYIHWNDPNELVERLELLAASRQAGNNNHDNEIISIVEELREANIIV